MNDKTTPMMAIALAWLVAGCEADKDNPPPAPAPTASVAADGAGASALAEGAAAPAVTMTLHDGRSVELASLSGKHVLVYFYPKDDTPGCRVEAQGIRDAWAEFEKAGVAVFGVSLQDAVSHQAFIDKESLPFPLVVDDGTLARAFGVPVKGEYAARQSFLIDPGGRLKKIWRQVDPKSHAAEVLAAVGG